MCRHYGGMEVVEAHVRPPVGVLRREGSWRAWARLTDRTLERNTLVELDFRIMRSIISALGFVLAQSVPYRAFSSTLRDQPVAP